MLLNITNHPSRYWSNAQLKAAEEFGSVVDLPFPQIRMDMSNEQINKLVDAYLIQILCHEDPVVLCQGEFVFTYRLIVLLKEHHIPVVACQGNLEREELQDENQNTIKQTVYRFARFLEY